MPIRVAIIGGGIGGLTLAVVLSQLQLDHLIEIDIYEAAPELTQVGAGITFWPRTWDILEKLGLDVALAEHLAPGQHVPDGTPRLAFQFRKGDQREGVPILDLVIAGAALSFHRASVQEILLKQLSPAIRTHLSSRFVSYEISPGKEITLHFENGTKATCDLLVGADGLRSTVRKQFVAENTPEGHVLLTDPVWSGTFAYRGMMSSQFIKERMPNHRVLSHPTIYCGKNKHIVAYPILQGKIVNVVAYVSDLRMEGSVYEGPSFKDVSREEVISLYDSWEAEVRILVQGMEKPSRWAIQAINILPRYAADNIFLLGDAAHAMTPHQGSGAGQAIEDAYILAKLIHKALHDSLSLHRLDQVYDEIRRPAANNVHAASRAHGLLYELNAPGFEWIKEGDEALPEEMLMTLGKMITDDWEYAWTTTIDKDLQKAMEAMS